MYVQQLSVFIENKQGRLSQFTMALKEAGVDLIALSVADTTNFGILRAIVSDSQRAYQAVKDAGYTVNLTEVLAVAVDDVPGGLHTVLELMDASDISVEYLYSFVRRVQHCAVIIFRVSQPEAACRLLQEKGVRLLTQEEIATT